MKRREKLVKFKSRQGLEVQVRRLTPDDVPYLVDLFEHMSATSRYLRFNEPLENPDPEYVQREAASLCDVDPQQGMAWIAFADLPQEPQAAVAGARFMRTVDPAVAEVSIVVRDDVQQQGIGSNLMLFVAEQAKAAGVGKIVASFHTSNRAIWNLLALAPFHVTTTVHGAQTEIVVELSGNHTHHLVNAVVADV